MAKRLFARGTSEASSKSSKERVTKPCVIGSFKTNFIALGFGVCSISAIFMSSSLFGPDVFFTFRRRHLLAMNRGMQRVRGQLGTLDALRKLADPGEHGQMPQMMLSLQVEAALEHLPELLDQNLGFGQGL